MTNNWWYALIHLLTEYVMKPLLRKLAWQIGGFIGRRRTGRAIGHNQWRSFLMGLSTYLWHQERYLYQRWFYDQLAKRQAAEFLNRVLLREEEAIQRDINAYGFWVSKDGRRVDPKLVTNEKWGKLQHEGYIFHGIADVLKPTDTWQSPNVNINVSNPLLDATQQAAARLEQLRRQQHD